MEFTGQIHEGDCLEIMRRWPAKSVGLIVTSPPYNIRQTVGNGTYNIHGSGKLKKVALSKGYENHEDDMSPADYICWQRECLTEMMRLLKDDGAIFYNHKWRIQGGLLQDRSDIVAGFPVRQIIIWDRKGGTNFNDTFFLPNYEVIYLIAKKGFKLLRKMNAVGCIWRFVPERNIPHPAPFPLELPERCIRACMKSPVLDPFIGSGTTAIAAEKYGVEWAGIELSLEYIKSANERIREYQSQRTFL